MRYRILFFLFVFTVSCSHHKIRFSRVKQTRVEQEHILAKDNSDTPKATPQNASVAQTTPVAVNTDNNVTLPAPNATTEDQESAAALTHPETSEKQTEQTVGDTKDEEAKRAELDAMDAKKSMIAALIMFFLLPLVWLIPFFFGISSIKKAEASRYITETGEQALRTARIIKNVILGLLIAILVVSIIGGLILIVFAY